MDFFQAQDSARTRTRTLVVLFVAAVAAIIAAVYLIFHAALGLWPRSTVDFDLLAAVAAGTILLVSIGSTVRTLQLRQGGGRVAELLGGRLVASNTTNEHERRLVNVVEEMAIASGTPVPAIYVLDGEDGINAFAAGYTLDDAAVAVTRGALTTLNRAELQGVIAHEFSHILNGDMRLNIRLLGLLYGILLLAVIGRGLLRGGHGGRRGRGGGDGKAALIGIGLIAVGYIGVFFGRLIQSAVSRQREYLADASAVQFTRAPEGLAGALKKIGAGGSRLESHHAAEASHLFFANGVGRPFASLLATHPPLTDRIRRIDPSFTGDFTLPEPADEPAVAGVSYVGPGGVGAGIAASRAAPVSAESIVDTIGAPRAEHVAFAHELLEALPENVHTAAHEPASAPALLFALLLSEGSDEQQLQMVSALNDDTVAANAAKLAASLRPLGPAARLPVLDVMLPALRALPPGARQTARMTAERLIRSDDRTDVFELAAYHVVRRQLFSEGNAAASAGVHSLAPLRAEVEVVLSAAAWHGADDERAARAAFDAGAKRLPPSAGPLSFRADPVLDLTEVDAALGRLRQAAPGVRRRLLEACVRVVTHDAAITVGEGEMLRAVSEALDCPMPPIAAGVSSSRLAGELPIQ